MNVLITNIWLVNQGGTEAYVRDLAIELQRRGHTVEVYSPQLGPFAKEIESAGIHVCNAPSELKHKPQIIHAHQFIPCMEVASQFTNVPIIYFAHDYSFPGDSPPKLDQIGKYVAVDDLCLRKLVQDFHIEESRTAVIHNWVDTNRFRLRTQFSVKVKRALVFSNYAHEGNYFKTLKEICLASGIELVGLGNGFNNSISNPEDILSNYDIVFAKGKAAMEAMASGAAVIVCDFRGLGAMVNAENFDFFRRYNFGMYTLDREITPELIRTEINKYDTSVVREMAKKIREVADFQSTINQLIRCYEEVLTSRKIETGSTLSDKNVHSTYKQSKSAMQPEVDALKDQLHHTRQHEQQLLVHVQELQKKNTELQTLNTKPSAPPHQIRMLESSSAGITSDYIYSAIKSEIPVQAIGEEMSREHGFLGVPSNSFEEAGKNQILTLLEHGLAPDSKVLEIGCGVLRVAYWLIRYLNANSYYGIEPAESRVQLGRKNLLSPAISIIKNPCFSYNAEFNTAIFKQTFDFFLAGSIWTHCGKKNIKIMLDGFVHRANPTGVFLTSYLPAMNEEEDYQGDIWVGTSHESTIAGCIKHQTSWIKRECEERDLIMEELPENAFDSQYWLKISKSSTDVSPSKLMRFLNIFRDKN